jgi:hypothetical protein
VEILEELDPNDHVRRGQVEAIVREVDVVKKVNAIIKFLEVDYPEGVGSCKKEDESVIGEDSGSSEVDRVNDAVNDRVNHPVNSST